MYSIYVDGVCFYNDQYSDEDYRLIEPQLKMADSAAGSLEFTMPPNNVCYDAIIRMKSEIVVYRESTEIWSGRAVKEEIDFWNNKKYFCEGELAYLNDSSQPQKEYHTTIRGFLNSLIQTHNSKVDSDKRFTIGLVTVTDNNDSIYRYTNYEKTLEAINDKLVSRLGGHLRIRKVNGTRYLDYLKDYPRLNKQVIEFGENLLDFTKSFDMTSYATVILPRGAQLEESDIEALPKYLTVDSVNDGSPYIQSAIAVKNYGWIEKIVDWDDVTIAANLKTKAEAYLSDLQFDDMQLELSALDLHYLNADEQPFELLDEVRCISVPHGMDHRFPVSEINLPLNHPEDTTYRLGTNIQTSLTAANNEIKAAIMNRIDKLPTRESVLKEAKQNATEIMNMATNGYVTTVIKDGHAEELIISDNEDYTKAEKLWRWNLNGFGYSKNGYKGEFGLAITMDGAIVADFITAGTLNADIVRAGILQDKLGYNYWDLDTGEFSLSPNTSIGDSTIQEYLDQNSQTVLNQANAYADQQAKLIQDQVDGAIESYYYDYQPTNSNEPAKSWTTNEEKKKHEGDIFFWKSRGYAYRYMKNDAGTGYEWRLIQDSDITSAIAKANAAQTTASKKITTYAQQAKPTANLVVGDIWIDTKNKNLMYRWNGSSWVNVRDQLMVDANNAAMAAQKAAETAKSDITATKKLVETLEKEQGYNILRGTNDTTSLTSSGQWKLSLWRAASQGTGTRTSIAITGPQENIFRGWRFTNASKDNNKINCDIAQDSIDMVSGKQYTISCYAKGTGKLILQYGYDRWTSKAFTLSKVNAWTRYSWTFTATNAASSGKYLVKNGLTNVYFGNRGIGTIEICGMMLELGGELHDYVMSSEEGAIKAMKESLTQQEIFNRLTNNGQTQGIYLKDKKLYVNASYIASGALSAKYVTTGLLTDKKKNSYWNLDTGIMDLKVQSLKIKSGNSWVAMDPRSIRVQSTTLAWKSANSSLSESGVFSCKGASIDGTLKTGNYSSGSYFEMSGGRIKSFYKKTAVGYIGTNSWMKNDNHRGLVFDLEPNGYYMTFAYRQKATDKEYTAKWTYTAKATMGCAANTLNAACDVSFGNYKIRNIGNGQDLGRVCIPISIRNDGSVKDWYIATIKDGIIQK